MNISISEIILVVLIALIVVRPEQMPEVAQTVGRMIRGVRRLFANVKNEMQGLIEPIEKHDERK